MRNVVLGLGAVDFLFRPKDYSMASFFSTIDTAVAGRKTHDVALKMGGGSFGAEMPTYIFSRSKPRGRRNGIEFVNESPASLIERLRKSPGKDIWMMGGGELAREFLKADLIDALYLGIVPTLPGAGIPLFPSGFPRRDFKLVENKSFSKGLIALRYKRARAK